MRNKSEMYCSGSMKLHKMEILKYHNTQEIIMTIKYLRLAVFVTLRSLMETVQPAVAKGSSIPYTCQHSQFSRETPVFLCPLPVSHFSHNVSLFIMMSPNTRLQYV